MTTATPLLLDRNVLPLAELFSLVLDGQLYRVGDAFAATDIPDTPSLRAQVFAALRPGSTVADRGTAAWIHGTRSMPPVRPQVCVDRGRRGRVSPDFDAQQHRLSDGEVVELSGVRVTAPLRTAADLMLTLPRFGPPEALEVRHLLELGRASPDRLGAHLARSHRHGATRALTRMPVVERTELPAPVSRR
ncbi:type IV toxin-antitoxin system AbiEi family antitoxin [Leifsonia sp. L25]|uniref:type IV toxin-antitoxin system AbiEi family antitoxin n=1 Tax=Actinomycetes TaxID=1760 RepID=UPI003D695507